MNLPAEISLRPVVVADEPLLLQIYATTRAAELALVPWDEMQRAWFVRSQYTAQVDFYEQEYPDAVHSLVLYEDAVAGRLYVHRRAQELRILDFTLLAHPQAEAIGTHLLRGLMKEAAFAGLPLNIHLEPFNPTQPLFEQCGFVKVSDNGAHALYEWRSA